MNDKTSINFIYPNLWAPTASLLQGLTVMQQCVYQMKLRDVHELKMRLWSQSNWYSLDWSGAEHYRYCCQWVEKASPCSCSHSGPTFLGILLQAVEKMDTWW